MKITVTGSSGFVGSRLVSYLQEASGNILTVPIRTGRNRPANGIRYIEVGNIITFQNWRDVAKGQDVIVHLAGRAHVFHGSSVDALAEFHEVNVTGTLNLAQLARDCGVKRFVFISSIGVNGGSTVDSTVNERSKPRPHADYSVSKWEAEQGLWEVARGSGMELVIIRPPLVYAGHAPGNFGRLLQLVANGIPLPFASVCNQRSMIALENLVDFIALCVDHSAAANQLFVISDGEDVSTPQIIQYLAKGMEKPSRLFPVPQSVLRTGARLVRKSHMYSQLCDSLVIDSSKAREVLGWRPVVSTHDALKKAGYDFLNSRSPS